jgi:hypothetical protein
MPRGHLYLFLFRSPPGARTPGTSDAAVQFSGSGGEFGDTVSVDGVVSVTSGDWDGDGRRDLASVKAAAAVSAPAQSSIYGGGVCTCSEISANGSATRGR